MLASMIQASKITLVRSYLIVSQAAGQLKKKRYFCFPLYANGFCDAGGVPILRYFEACYLSHDIN